MKHPKHDRRPQIVKTIENLINEIRDLEKERPRFVYPFVTEVTKTIMVEASHLLPNHKEKCQFLHGHSYRVDVTLRSRLWEGKGDSTEGMVVDFKTIKEALKVYVDDVFDHSYVNNELYERHYDITGRQTNDILYLRTTAEQMAWWVFIRLYEGFETLNVDEAEHNRHNLLEVVQVDVYETTTSKATAKREYFNYDLMRNNLKGHIEMLTPQVVSQNSVETMANSKNVYNSRKVKDVPVNVPDSMPIEDFDDEDFDDEDL